MLPFMPWLAIHTWGVGMAVGREGDQASMDLNNYNSFGLGLGLKVGQVGRGGDDVELALERGRKMAQWKGVMLCQFLQSKCLEIRPFPYWRSSKYCLR